jgi:hypothetical protein
MSDWSKPYSGFASVRREWDEAGGSQTSVNARITMKPSSTWELTMGRNLSCNRAFAQYVTTEMGPNLSFNNAFAQYVSSREDPLATETFGARYIFGELEQTTLSMETRLNVTFTPNLTLELFAQPFIASGDYGQLRELKQAGTFDFIDYGIDAGEISLDDDGNTLVDPDGTGPAEPFTVYNSDFNRVSLRGTGVIRWEWRPGSTLFLVWQQSRSDRYKDGHFDFGRDADAMFAARADNIFMVKATYWIGS